MDKERLNHLTQEGDPEAAEEFMRIALRSGDRQGQIDAAFGILVDSVGSGDASRSREMFDFLMSLEAYEEAFCWFQDEISRLKVLATCPKCEGTGKVLSHYSDKTRYEKPCEKCDEGGLLPLDEAAEVACLLSRFPFSVDQKERLSLYFRCLEIWYPQGWAEWIIKHRDSTDTISETARWIERSVPVKNCYDPTAPENLYNPENYLETTVLELPEVPLCVCNGEGGCSHCLGRCPVCGMSMENYRNRSPKIKFNNPNHPLWCAGSRDGYCRGGGCEYCNDSDKCQRCGK